MTVELDHTIIPASDKVRAAGFLADLLGLEVAPPSGPFAPVPVNDRLTLDFDDRRGAVTGHWAFAVDDATFDRAVAHLGVGDAPFGAGPGHGWDRTIDRSGGHRRVYVEDPDGHVYELISSA
jgi:catechol 2,3-dioxygenase-like lactoylglutathione lyase family enzyme